jgi:hypothetical protein
MNGPVSLTIIGGYRVSIWLLGTVKKQGRFLPLNCWRVRRPCFYGGRKSRVLDSAAGAPVVVPEVVPVVPLIVAKVVPEGVLEAGLSSLSVALASAIDEQNSYEERVPVAFYKNRK